MDGNSQPHNEDGSSHFQPGETISPRTAGPMPAQQSTAPPQPVSQPVYTEPEVLHPRSVATPPTGADGSISWTASEFVAHHKSNSWYVLVAVAAIALAAIIWLVVHDIVSAVVVLIAAVAFGVVGARQPRELTYRLDGSGLTIGSKHFVYEQFRSFSILPEGAFASIVFMPLKRFAMLTTVYYDPSDENKIVDLLSERLPLEDRQHDLVDRLMWRIRF